MAHSAEAEQCKLTLAIFKKYTELCDIFYYDSYYFNMYIFIYQEHNITTSITKIVSSMLLL